MVRSRRATSWRLIALVTALLLIPPSFAVAGRGHPDSKVDPAFTGDIPVLRPGADFPELDEESEEELLASDIAILSNRLAGSRPLSLQEASAYRAAAARYANFLKKQGSLPPGATTFDGAWTSSGPRPIGEVTRSTNSIVPMNGRIGALAIREDGTFILGAAGGGIWTYDGSTWTPHTDDLPSLAIGALAIAPNDGSVVYAGTGEGALSGDSYFGNGILKSTDGGATWSHVSGDYFVSVSISRLQVDPNDDNHLFASVLRGRGGARRTSPALHSEYGIWESTDGAATWNLLMEAPAGTNGATDLEMDPQNPDVMYASFWADQVYKSTDGGHTWGPAMNGLPSQGNAENLTRFSIGLAHPEGQDAVLYVGSDFIDENGDYQQSRLFRSDDEGASWDELPTTGFSGAVDSVLDYCGGQCWYDNVVEVDPTDTEIVYAGGQFNYGARSGGLFRSDDGGQTWKDIGWDLHPDYHAFAFDPDDPDAILVGSDGGVWYSPDRGGRMPGSENEGSRSAGDLRLGNRNTGGLQIAQFTSMATNPTLPTRMWGGTQDNGTLAKYGNTWYDLSSGDGGQVVVDPTDFNYVYGTYFGISPYRYDDGGTAFFSNNPIYNGLNVNERSGFYIPFVLNQNNPDQLFLGTYRIYRTDNAKAPSAGDVLWRPISPDLTEGCGGAAPNGAASCTLSAIGVGGGTAVYSGSLDGRVYVSSDAQINASPTWVRIDQKGLPKRPVASIAVDRSNYRIAYFGYNGFSAATPGRPGHVYKTTNSGKTVTDISGNLPDSPVNSIVLDPSFPNTLYAGTDVGPFVTYDGGAHWNAMGTGFPIVSIWQLDLDPSHRTIAAGTHGRGAFVMNDSVASSALVVSKVAADVPIGPSSKLDYTITLRNIGNADATGVEITDPIPANTSFESVADGGSYANGKVTWTGLSVPAGGRVDVHFSVDVAPALKKKVNGITNDGIVVTSAEGPGATGSPTFTPLAPSYAMSITPASQAGAARVGEAETYLVSIRNRGFSPDAYSVSASGGAYATQVLDATCTTPLSTTDTVASGATEQVCVSVTVPGGAADGDSDRSTITATSTSDPSVTGSVEVTTYAVAFDTVLVDGDGDGPDVQQYYANALDSAGVSYGVWDLADNPSLPADYLEAHSTVVWFTGNSYPAPISRYEAQLASFLDGGGNLFMSGQDILDQAAGTTPFVSNYLHIDWDGTETQNDIPTDSVFGISGNPVTGAIGEIPLDHSVLGAAFEDEITPIAPAEAAFTDDAGETNALDVDSGTYKVVFLAFPFEAYGTADDKLDLLNAVLTYFGP